MRVHPRHSGTRRTLPGKFQGTFQNMAAASDGFCIFFCKERLPLLVLLRKGLGPHVIDGHAVVFLRLRDSPWPYSLSLSVTPAHAVYTESFSAAERSPWFLVLPRSYGRLWAFGRRGLHR